MKTITQISQWISFMFSPLWIPTYFVIIVLNINTPLCFLPSGIKLIITAAVLAMTGLVPLGAMFILKSMGVTSSIGLYDRRERTVPFIISMLCFAACALFFYRLNVSPLLWRMMAGALVAVVVQLIINSWGWKISAHAAGIAGGLGALANIPLWFGSQVDITWILITGVVITGLLGTARLILNYHSLGQVLGGWANGFLCVLLVTCPW